MHFFLSLSLSFSFPFSLSFYLFRKNITIIKLLPEKARKLLRSLCPSNRQRVPQKGMTIKTLWRGNSHFTLGFSIRYFVIKLRISFYFSSLSLIYEIIFIFSYLFTRVFRLLAVSDMNNYLYNVNRNNKDNTNDKDGSDESTRLFTLKIQRIS